VTSKLLVLDLDGTALGGYEPYARLPDPLAAVLDQWVEAGNTWVTCTTWHPQAQAPMIRGSQLRHRPARMVGRSGLSCGCFDAQDRCVLDGAWDLDLVVKLHDYINDVLPDLREQVAALTSCSAVATSPDGLLSIKLRDKTEGVAAVEALATVQAHAWLQPPERESGVLQLYPAFMTKAHGLARVQRELDLGPQVTLAAGNGHNDLSMLTRDRAAVLLCPQNADPLVQQRVREQGGYIGNAPYADGVIDALRQADAIPEPVSP